MEKLSIKSEAKIDQVEAKVDRLDVKFHQLATASWIVRSLKGLTSGLIMAKKKWRKWEIVSIVDLITFSFKCLSL